MLLIILLTALFLASSVTADPVLEKGSPVTVPIFQRTNFTSVNNLLRHDRTRAKLLKAPNVAKADNMSLSQRDGISVAIVNQAMTYVASVGVGCPPTYYSLIIDTGSSNTWIGAETPYFPTKCSCLKPDVEYILYGSGSQVGIEYTVTVTLASLVIPNQCIGVAKAAFGFGGFDGILGLGPDDLTEDTLFPDTNATIPTVTDNAYRYGKISINLIGVSFNPTTSTGNKTGELSFGGVDQSKFVGPITYINITGTAPASYYWGINSFFHYGNSTAILPTTAGIVDTGTTLLLLATDAFNNYKNAIGASLDQTTGLLKISSSNFNALQILYFDFGDRTFGLVPDAQIWPRALNTAIGGEPENIYLIVGDIGTNSGKGLDFIMGYALLERFYSVFDTTNKRVGFATTPFTNATINYQV